MHCATCSKSIDDEAAFCPYCGTAVEGAPSYDEYDYEAFISYRHLPRERKVAMRLERTLEGMRIPKSVRSEGAPAHLGKLFRDEDELPTSDSLGDQIRGALKHSRYLVVVCSPKTNESLWVTREVELYASFHGRARIRVALVEGEPNESLPTLLRTHLVKNDKGDIEEVEDEPLAADFRTDDRKTFRAESLRIAATLIGCGYDDLVRRLHARRMRLVAVSATVVAAVSLTFGSFSVWQQHQIEKNYRQTQINESEALAVESQELLSAGDRMEAIQVALAALPKSSTSNDRPFVPAAQIALQDALQAYPLESFWRSCYAAKEVDEDCATSKEGLVAYHGTDGTVETRDLKTGETLAAIDLQEALGDSGAKNNDSNLVFCKAGLVCGVGNGRLALVDPRTGDLLWDRDLQIGTTPWDGKNVAVNEEGTLVAVGVLGADGSQGVTVYLIDAADGSVRASYPLSFDHLPEDVERDYRVALAFSPDGNHLAATCSSSIWRINLADGSTLAERTSAKYAKDLGYYANTIVAISNDTLLSSDSCHFEAFSAELNPLWSKHEQPYIYYDTTGIWHTNHGFVAGTDEKDDATRLAYVCGGKAAIVNLATGEEIQTVQHQSPIRACLFQNDYLHTIDYEGFLTSKYYKPDDGTMLGLAEETVAEGEDASLASTEDGVFALAYDSGTRAYRTYRFANRTDDIAGREPVESLAGKETYANLSFNNDFYLILRNDDGVSVMGEDSFEPLWSTSFKELGLGDSVEMETSDGTLLFYTKRAVGDKFLVKGMSLVTGDTTDELALPKDTYGWTSINEVGLCTATGEPSLYVVAHETGGDHVRCFSRSDAHQMLDIGPLDYNTSTVLHTNDVLLSVYDKDGRWHLDAFSLADGRRIEGAFDDLALDGGGSKADRYVSASSDQGSIVVACAGGSVCCLDTASWSPRWKRDISNVRLVDFSADDRHLLAQDNTGTCFLLDASSGETLRTSSVRLPLISGILHDKSDPTNLYAFCLKTGLSRPETVFTTISLDEDAFGPTCRVYSGVFPMRKQGKVLTHDTLFGDWGVCPYHPLDELIDMGRVAVEGHELSGTEQQRYRIASLA